MNANVGLRENEDIVRLSRFRMLTVGSISLIYLIVFVFVVIPLLKTETDPSAPWPDFSATDWVLYAAYVPAVETAAALTDVMPFSSGPQEIGVFLTVSIFGAMWGILLFLLGKGLFEIIRKQPNKNIEVIVANAPKPHI